MSHRRIEIPLPPGIEIPCGPHRNAVREVSPIARFATPSAPLSLRGGKFRRARM
jgi:hypothetical protein